MKIYRMTGKLIYASRLKNSVNGNPRWNFIVLSNDQCYEFKTKTDSAVGYKFKRLLFNEVTVDYHVTRSGNLICENIEYGSYKGVV